MTQTAKEKIIEILKQNNGGSSIERIEYYMGNRFIMDKMLDNGELIYRDGRVYLCPQSTVKAQGMK